MPPPIVADRFLANGASWIDLATGRAVRLRVAAAGDRRAQLYWSDLCAAYARLRHPWLNPLVDFGALDGKRVFEAYAAQGLVRTTQAGAHRLLTHAMQFLRAHGVTLAADQAALARRGTAVGPLARGRPLGIVLQDRTVLAAVDEVLDAAWPGGPGLISVSGPPSSGLRTVQIHVARAARLRGYVPVAPAAIAGRPWMVDLLVERHVCVLAEGHADDAAHRALGSLLDALGRASTRRHVVIAFTRGPAPGRTVIPIRSMGVRAMASMVFVDADGPSAAELFEAARGAEGKPGLFLDRLGAQAFEPHVSSALVAHESVQPYNIDRQDRPAGRPNARRPVSRIAGALARAAERGDALAVRGRHASAVRVLSRATRVLSARGAVNEAARCASRLGYLHLSRGHVAAASIEFERARSSGGDADVVRLAALGLAASWADDARLAEAEALLRSMAVTAELEHRPDARVAHALARCLYWQGRRGEAAAALRPHLEIPQDPRCLALASRIQVADGVSTMGLQLARRAMQDINATTTDDVVAELERALAAALTAAGDYVAAKQHVECALHAARRAHRPIDVLRARILDLDVLAQADPGAASIRRLADRLLALGGRIALPRLVRFQLHKTIESALGTPADAPTLALEQQGVRWPRARVGADARAAGMTELEALLEVCHTANDDREALDRLCATALDRLRAVAIVIVSANQRRVTGQSGKPWDGQTPAVTRALTSAASAAVQDAVDDARLEVAEPVRFGGEVIGAVACRWIAGTAVCPARTAATMKATALAAAAPLRAVLDRVLPDAPDAAWTDLLGESAEASALREAVARASRAPYPVLIEGESGCGKELVARAVHRLGARRDRRFCAVNCAALSDELLEAELFGHTRGAFTGALTERSGLFEEADGGTLFLDEIGELSPRAQAKLLRVIQEGEIRRVGESFSRKVDVRIVAATNRRLEQEAAAGRFRVDLRFRLDVIRIAVPPLRERVADIALLAAHFWSEAARRVGSRATLSPDALAALSRYDWPGNVRELQNAIAWIAVHSPRRGRLGAASLPAGIAGVLPAAPVTFETAREDFERRFIRSALARANGHRASAAESLGITRQGLAKMMRRLRIDDRPFA